MIQNAAIGRKKCYNVTMLHRKRVEGVFFYYIYYILNTPPLSPKIGEIFVAKNGVDFREKGTKNGEKRKESV